MKLHLPLKIEPMDFLEKTEEDKLPRPLFDAYHAFKQEDPNQPFRQVHRLIDLIEVFCKLYTVGTMSTFLAAIQEKMDSTSKLDEAALTKVKVMLSAGLKTPSLGIWWMFARDITKILQELNVPHLFTGAENELIGDKSKIRKAFDGEKNLITFRNDYAHGATPNDADCRKHLALYWPRVKELLLLAKSLQTVDIIICDAQKDFYTVQSDTLEPFTATLSMQPGHIWLKSEEALIDVFPLLCFKKSESTLDFFFYNDLKEKHANYLNYPNAEHFKDIDLKTELLSYIPIHEWKNIGNVELDPFKQQIDLLTEVFKGRKHELAQIASFLNTEENQFLCIWGPPGVGKSALLARSAQILRYNPEVREVLENGDDWPQAKVHLVDYFIRRGSKNTALDFFDSVNQRLDHLFHLRLASGKTPQEKRDLFEQRLSEISKKLAFDEQLLFIVDGLDEIETNDPLLNLLPRLLPKKIKVIYGARPQTDLKFTFYEELYREAKHQFDLGGLSEPDIRAVLMEHVSKYEMEDLYVSQVLLKSEGNPLYLKLLCQGLEKRIYALNDSFGLPRQMSELYEKALKRLEEETPSSITFLLYLSAAKDYVSPRMAAAWMNMKESTLTNTILYGCLEFLFENPLTENLNDYQLFHESLREYLSEAYPTELQECKERICDFSFAWKDEHGDLLLENELLSYAMNFGTEHIYESYVTSRKRKKKQPTERRRSQLFELAENDAWRSLNYITCGHGEPIKKSYYYLQKITSYEDATGEKLNDFFAYGLNRYLEPERMYVKQHRELSSVVPAHELQKHLEKTPALAKMGENDEERILLALLPLWANTSNVTIPQNLEKQIEEWMENNRSSAITKLWKITRNKLK
jgi:hypothetical protein